MTEAEWLASGDPRHLLEFLQGRASDRKLRLFSCTSARFCSCYRLPEESPDYAAICAVEDWAQSGHPTILADAQSIARSAGAKWACGTDPFEGACNWASLAHAVPRQAEGYCDRVRCIFGNAFHPLSINPTWLTATVSNLAKAAYEERALPSGELDTARLSILADALEESDCDNQDMLGHLRSPGTHTRGCWPLDLVLGLS